MADNYHDTVYRMYEASDLLFHNEQWFNANYLAGYVAECYCKLILQISRREGYCFQGSKNSERDFGHNVEGMYDEIALLAMNGYSISAYCIDLSIECSEILNHWNPNRRYESNACILNSKELGESIHKEMEKLIDYIIKMEVDGVFI